MIKAIYPGTFDPITVGHLDVILRSAKIYDKLIVAVMENRAKKCTFSKEERKQMIEKCIEGLENVEVVIGEGLTVNLANLYDCRILIRGVRAVSDYESELALATANMNLNPEVETVQVEREKWTDPNEVADETALQPINWVNVGARVVFMPYVFSYGLVSNATLNLLFLLYGFPMPVAAFVGYMMGPKLRQKKLKDIALGKKRKMRNLKVNRQRKPRGPKAEV